jgi:hypothetical protein
MGLGGSAWWLIALAGHAEFPGTFTDEMVASGIFYDVGEETHPEHSISMTQLRLALECNGCDELASIAGVRVHPLAGGFARYTVVHKSGKAATVAFGEYPGRVIDELVHAKVPYVLANEP